jgi:hypothetical protein
MLLARVDLVVKAFIVLFALSASACAEGIEPKEVQTASLNPKSIPIEVVGEVVQAFIWLEHGDSNLVVISDEESGDQCQPAYVNRLHGIRASKRAGGWTKQWEIKDFGQGPCYKPHFQKSSFHVFDVDGKGAFETLFFYSIAQDGAAPYTLKMMFHWNGTKLPIRGTIPLVPEDSSAYQYQLDLGFGKAPRPIAEFAEAFWKGYISAKYPSLVRSGK